MLPFFFYAIVHVNKRHNVYKIVHKNAQFDRIKIFPIPNNTYTISMFDKDHPLHKIRFTFAPLVCLGLMSLSHLRPYRDDAFLWQWYFLQCAATPECHAADTGHDSPPHHSTCIQSRGRHVVLLYIDVERHTVYTITHFNMLGQTRPGNL